MAKAAAVYAHISSDPDGTDLGVDRQIEDCEALAASLGWPVRGVYVDNVDLVPSPDAWTASAYRSLSSRSIISSSPPAGGSQSTWTTSSS